MRGDQEALPLVERRKVERAGRMIQKAEAELSTAPNSPPSGPRPREQADVMSNDIEEATLATLKAAGELSAAQFALDGTPDATTAPRDFAARKVVDAFRTWEAGAKAIKSPVRVSITLRPTEK